MSWGPKPLVEEHYHIAELVERQEKRTEDRVRHQNMEKESGEREKTMADSKQVELVDFWCGGCGKDFKGAAFKQIETDWSNPNQRIAFYKTKCFCGRWCARFVTDKDADPYWQRSKKVRADRAAHAEDLIQPFEEGFNLLYGKKQ